MLVIFESDRDGNENIFLIQDGQVPVNLSAVSDATAQDQQPRFSPDGRTIAFIRNSDLYLMNWDGTGVRRLTSDGGSKRLASWSPDGSKLVYTRNDTQIWTIDSDGSDDTALTTAGGQQLYPCFHPDGLRVVFQDSGNLYTVPLSDGSDIQLFIGDANHPHFSADGTKLAFCANRDGDPEVYKADADGTNQVRLTVDPGEDYYPHWSTDGSQIVFASTRDGDYEIYSMYADGSGPTNLTNLPSYDDHPSWWHSGILPPPPTHTPTVTNTLTPSPTNTSTATYTPTVTLTDTPVLCSCKAIRDADAGAPSGLYLIRPLCDSSITITTYCDMQNAGGGWTLVLLNSPFAGAPAPYWTTAIGGVSGSVPADLDGSASDYFLGLQYWKALGTELMAEVRTGGSVIHRAAFTMDLNAAAYYTLTLTNPSLLAGADLPGLYTYHNGRPFSTRDLDNDASTQNCSTLYSNTPWWYGNCFSGSFWGGGPYPTVAYWTGSTTDYGTHGMIWVR